MGRVIDLTRCVLWLLCLAALVQFLFLDSV